MPLETPFPLLELPPLGFCLSTVPLDKPLPDFLLFFVLVVFLFLAFRLLLVLLFLLFFLLLVLSCLLSFLEGLVGLVFLPLLLRVVVRPLPADRPPVVVRPLVVGRPLVEGRLLVGGFLLAGDFLVVVVVCFFLFLLSGSGSELEFDLRF